MRSKDLIRMDVMNAAAVLRGMGKMEYEGDLFERGETDRQALVEAYTETLDVLNYIYFEMTFGDENLEGREELGKLRDHAFLLAMEIKGICLKRQNQSGEGR